MDSLKSSTVSLGFEGRDFEIWGIEGDHILERIRRTGVFYELDLLLYMRRAMRRAGKLGGLAIDVGANIGNHSIFIGNFIADTVINVEPNPKILPLLEANLKQNLDAAYHLVPCALGESDGFIEFDTGSTENMGKAGSSTTAGEQISVEVRRLDDVVDEVRQRSIEPLPVQLIKIDVEGMEPKVLAGAERTLTEDRPELFLEAESRREFDTIREVLAPLGYVAITRWAATPVYHFTHRPSIGKRVDAALHYLTYKPIHYLKKVNGYR